MEWTNNIREELKPSIVDISKPSKITIASNKWATIRDTVLKKYNYNCRYCGGHYIKYLMCIHLDNNSNNNDISNLDLCCKVCYDITHINNSFNNEMIVCYSQLSQLEIVRKTIDFIINNNKVPKINNIDKNASRVQLSVMEFSNILVHSKQNKYNYKIFFTEKLDTTFVSANIKVPMFIDELSNELSNEFTEGRELSNEFTEEHNQTNAEKVHIFPDNELQYLKSIFL